jgi:protein TonB
MSYAQSGRGRERIVAIGLVGLVQGGIIAALISGLAVQVITKHVDPPLTTYPVPEEVPPPPDPIPPKPLPKTTSPSTPLPVAPTPVVPVAITSPIATTTVIPPTPTVAILPSLPSVPGVPPAPAADLTRGAAARGDVGSWFPRSEYPAASLRAGSEGRVVVAVQVSPTGRATSCEVLTGSGDAALDGATCRLAIRNGRFEPARDAQGTRTATRLVLPAVRWRLEG